MKIKPTVAILLLIPWIAACGVHYSVTGQVVDAETGQPVQEAVVAVKWFRSKFGIPGLPTPIADYGTTENLTDSQGNFSVPKYPFGTHFMAVYKKEYICWSSDTIFNPQGKEWKEMFAPRYGHRVASGMVVKLVVKGENFPKENHAGFVLNVCTALSSPKPKFNQSVIEEYEIYEKFIIERDGKEKK